MVARTPISRRVSDPSNRMAAKNLLKFEAVVRDNGGVILSCYLGVEAFKTRPNEVSTRIHVLRQEEPEFQFNRDYEEYFDGIPAAGAEVIFSGDLALSNHRKVEYVDRTAKIGRTYCYWVSEAEDGALPVGPRAVKVRDRSVWQPYAEIKKRLSQLSGARELAVEVEKVGETTKRNPILGLRMGNRQLSVALIGAVHAGESGPELIVSVVEKLLEQDSDLLQQCGVVALPTVNVDERERQLEGIPWYLRTNANGVDLNRNFPADWETVETGYGLVSSDPDAITYRGPHAGSEAETQAVMRFFESTRPQVVFSFHCLAGICSPPFLTSRFSEEDETFAGKCRNVTSSYTQGYYADDREPQINYGTSAGSLPHWMYHNGAVPCFDLEWDGDEKTRACLSDQTTPEMIEECAERHYRGIRAVLESLSKIQ